MKKWVVWLVLMGLFSSFSRNELTWTAIGDSITYLNDHPDETGNRITKGYMTQVTEKLPHIRYTNQGHNGWTAVRIAESIETLGLTKADIYSVFLGTNDWWSGKPLGRFTDYRNGTGTGTVYGAFRVIVDKLRQLNPQAHIVLITPMQRADFVYIARHSNVAYGSYRAKNGQLLETFAQAIDSIGRFEQLPVVDLYHLKGLDVRQLVKYKRLKDPQAGVYTNYPYPGFIDIPYNPETDEYPYPPDAIDKTYDGLHPSDKGYTLISRCLIKVLRTY